MKSENIRSRLANLPLRHKIIAVLGATLVACGFTAILLTRSAEYQSSALLSYAEPAQMGASEETLTPATLTGSILTADAIASSFAPIGVTTNPYDGDDAASLRSHLSISDVPPSRVRVSWTGHDAQQTQDAEKAVTYLLTSWAPQSAPVETLVGRKSKEDNPDREKEEALLRVTIAMLDVRTAEVTSELRKMESPSAKSNNEHKSNLEAQIKQFQAEKLVVMQRLTESSSQEPRLQSSAGAARAQPVNLVKTNFGKRSIHRTALEGNGNTGSVPLNVDSSSSSKLTKPFVVLENDAVAQPLNGFSWQMGALAVLNGVAFGLFYLAAALWRFRPVQGAASLTKFLPGRNLLVGTIVEIKH